MRNHMINTINELLTDSDYKQKQLAEELGIDPSRMSRILRDETEMTIDELVGISKILGVRVEYILGLSPDKDEESHRTRLFLELFNQVTNADEFKGSKHGVITLADMKFSKMGDNFTILIGSVRLFTLIDRVAGLNSRKAQGMLSDDEFAKLMKKAWRQFSTSNTKKRSGRFLISPKQFKAEEERTKQFARLLNDLSEQET